MALSAWFPGNVNVFGLEMHPITFMMIIGIAIQGLAECFLSPKWLEFASLQSIEADRIGHESVHERHPVVAVVRRARIVVIRLGSTREDACKSTLRGSNYATSQVEITADSVSSWDQGFDANGEQVWGAVKGAYVFDRISTE